MLESKCQGRGSPATPKPAGAHPRFGAGRGPFATPGDLWGGGHRRSGALLPAQRCCCGDRDRVMGGLCCFPGLPALWEPPPCAVPGVQGHVAGTGSAPAGSGAVCHRVCWGCDRPLGGSALCCDGSNAQRGQGWAIGCSILCKGLHQDVGTSGASVASSTCPQPGRGPAAWRHRSLLQRPGPCVEPCLLAPASAPRAGAAASPRQDESGVASFPACKRSTKRRLCRERASLGASALPCCGGFSAHLLPIRASGVN